MKASEAMRLGAMASGQAFGLLEDAAGNTCALGAIRRAIGLPTRNMGTMELFASSVMLHETFPILLTDVASRCPGCSMEIGGPAYLGDLVVHLNNDDRWTRSQIADLIQEYEERAAAAAAPVEELVSAL